MRSIYITLLTKGNRYAKHFLKTASVIAVAYRTTILHCQHHLRLLLRQQTNSFASLIWSRPDYQKIIEAKASSNWRGSSYAHQDNPSISGAALGPEEGLGKGLERREEGEKTSEIKEQRQAGQGRAGSSGPLAYSQAAPPTHSRPEPCCRPEA